MQAEGRRSRGGRSVDGAILSGSFPLVGQNGNWTLTRPPAVATPAPPPAAHPGLPFALPPQRQTFGGPPTTPADRDPAFRRFQDRAEDSARDAGFNIQRREPLSTDKPK